MIFDNVFYPYHNVIVLEMMTLSKVFSSEKKAKHKNKWLIQYKPANVSYSLQHVHMSRSGFFNSTTIDEILF